MTKLQAVLEHIFSEIKIHNTTKLSPTEKRQLLADYLTIGNNAVTIFYEDKTRPATFEAEEALKKLSSSKFYEMLLWQRGAAKRTNGRADKSKDNVADLNDNRTSRNKKRIKVKHTKKTINSRRKRTSHKAEDL